MGLTASAYLSPDKPPVNYDESKGSLRTGDIILFDGNTLESLVVQIGTVSPWSHVGMVVRMESYEGPHADADGLYMWHSYGNRVKKAPDVLGKPSALKDGPQLISLGRSLVRYKGAIFVRRLNPAGIAQVVEHSDQKAVMAWMRVVVKTHYERSLDELFYAAYDGPFGHNTEEDEDSYFCSELLAETYSRLGLLDKRRADSPSEYTPYDFSSRGRISWDFISDVALGQEQQLVMR